MPKFLIIRFSSIGDIVLTTPVVRCLKKQVPGAGIHFLTTDALRSVIEHNPYIDKLHVLAHSRELMMEELKTEEYDFIIDLHHNANTHQLKKTLQKKSFSFQRLSIEKSIYSSLKINIMPKGHVVDRYLKTVSSFGVRNDGAGLDYFISKEEEISKQDIPASHSAGYIACLISAHHGTKKWPVHKWKELCLKMDHPIILAGEKEDAVNGKEIAAIDDVKIYNACGKFRLNETADIIRRSKLVITNDSDLMHIAAAFKRPIISLWGNTVPSFGMYPYYGISSLTDIRFQVNKLWCRPCSVNGYAKCPLGHFKCMEHISAEAVLQAAVSLL